MNDTPVPRYITSTGFAIGTLVILTAMSPQCIGTPPERNTSRTADNGNGVSSNPLFYVFSNVHGVGLHVFRSKSIHDP